MLYGEWRGKKGPRRQTGILSLLVFQVIWYSVALILFLHCEWMVPKLKYMFPWGRKTAGKSASSILVGILGYHPLGRRHIYPPTPTLRAHALTFSSKIVLINGQVTPKALWELGLCLCCLSGDLVFRIAA